jgi:hypothetical protein
MMNVNTHTNYFNSISTQKQFSEKMSFHFGMKKLLFAFWSFQLEVISRKYSELLLLINSQRNLVILPLKLWHDMVR